VERSAVQQPTFGRHAAGRCATDPEASLHVGMNTVVAGCVGALVLDPQNADTCAPIARSVTARASAMSGAITSERRDGWIAWVDMTPPSLGGNLVRSVETDGRGRQSRRNRPHGYV
jgi:hypothetical protein